MTIHPIHQVRHIYAQALKEAPDADAALRATAQMLALPVEAVRDVVGCEEVA